MTPLTYICERGGVAPWGDHRARKRPDRVRARLQEHGVADLDPVVGQARLAPPMDQARLMQVGHAVLHLPLRVAQVRSPLRVILLQRLPIEQALLQDDLARGLVLDALDSVPPNDVLQDVNGAVVDRAALATGGLGGRRFAPKHRVLSPDRPGVRPGQPQFIDGAAGVGGLPVVFLARIAQKFLRPRVARVGIGRVFLFHTLRHLHGAWSRRPGPGANWSGPPYFS